MMTTITTSSCIERLEVIKEEEEIKETEEEHKQALLKQEILFNLYPYYRWLFPNRLVANWLSEGLTAKESVQREFAFKQSKDDVFIRYQQYNNPHEFYKAILDHLPIKIDIGGLYEFQHIPFQNGKELVYFQRELVFDVDANDYNTTRKCGCDNTVCNQCWILMEAAIKVIQSNLELDFGYENIQFFYSGRRGIHCWVRDARARVLNNEERSAVLKYITIKNLDNLNQLKFSKELFYDHLHPKLQRDWETLEMMFPNYCRNQNIYLGESGYIDLVNDYIHTQYEKDKLMGQLTQIELRYLIPPVTMRGDGNPAYLIFKQRVIKLLQTSRYPSYDLRKCLVLVVFHHLYPRLDAGVTKTINHLLRCPFSVHGETGKICVPISSINEFQLDKVPTIMQLIKELNAIPNDPPNSTDNSTSTSEEKKKKKYRAFKWKQTSLAPFIRSLLPTNQTTG